MGKGTQSLVLMLMVVAVASGLVYWRQEVVRLQPVAKAPAVVVAEPVVPPIRHPLFVPEATLTPDAVPGAVRKLLGRDATRRFVLLDEFPRRVVAAVDGLGRSHVATGLWPSHPTAGRFAVQEAGEGFVIAPSNAKRYRPLVRVVERIDAGKLAELYLRMYPMLQRSYEELDHTNRFFNDRVIEVIDLLLATPDAGDRAKLQLTEVKTPGKSGQPWVRYVYADPSLESLSSGQKILLRVGPEHERKLKAKLVQFRQAILKLPSAPR